MAVNKKNVRVVSLIVCMFTYLLVGAAIFDTLESERELQHLHEMLILKNNLTGHYNMSEAQYNELRKVVIGLVPHNAVQWKFAGSFYYAIIVMTAIGYGHSVPRTHGGKMFTVFYSLLGIPFGLIVFQSIGERLNGFATFLLVNIKKLFRFKNAEVSTTNLIIVVSGLAVMVVFVGAAVFNYYEGWGYLNAVYYCIITLTTIGFGDFVALQNTQKVPLEKRPEYVVFTLMFIIVGLTVLSMNMNLMVLRFMTANQEEFLEEENRVPDMGYRLRRWSSLDSWIDKIFSEQLSGDEDDDSEELAAQKAAQEGKIIGLSEEENNCGGEKFGDRKQSDSGRSCSSSEFTSTRTSFSSTFSKLSNSSSRTSSSLLKKNRSLSTTLHMNTDLFIVDEEIDDHAPLPSTRWSPSSVSSVVTGPSQTSQNSSKVHIYLRKKSTPQQQLVEKA